MDKLKMTSKGAVPSNVEKIAALFPNCVTERLDKDGNPEAVVDFDKLRQELSTELVEGAAERYQFTWPDKRAANHLANQPTTMTLRPCEEESVGKDGTNGVFDSENLYIEGDNLDVLKVLRESYLGKVKMIYIDPPYNTGTDYVYHDDFAISSDEYMSKSGLLDNEGNLVVGSMVRNLETNGRFHTDWLNMIYPRLKVARDFLTDDGLIFISIDDREAYNLTKVCNEIFGETNLINTISVNMNSLSGVKMTHSIKGKRFPTQKETLLVYKKGNKQPILIIPKTHKAEWDKEYNLIIPELTQELYCQIPTMEINSLNELLSKMHLESLSSYCSRNGIKVTEDWKWQNAFRIFGTKSNTSLAAKMRDQVFAQDVVAFVNSEGNNRFFIGNFNRTARDPRIELVNAESNSSVFISDNWIDISNDGGVAQEGEVPYPNGKKPLQLISRIVDSSNLKDGDIVMDFFAGSSTTAHAVMLECAKKSKRVNFIMVQHPDNLDESLSSSTGDTKKQIQLIISFLDKIKKPHVLTEIGKERIKCAGRQILESDSTEVENLFTDIEYKQKLDIGFRVLKLAESNMENVFYTPDKLDANNLFTLANNVKQDRTAEDLLFQVMLELGVELSSPIEKKSINGVEVFNVKDGFLIATFDKDVNESTITEIAKSEPVYFVMRDASAANDNVLDNFDQLFRHYSPDTIRRIL